MRRQPEDMRDQIVRMREYRADKPNPAILYPNDGSQRKMKVNGVPMHVREPRLSPIYLGKEDDYVEVGPRFDHLVYDLIGVVDGVLLYVQQGKEIKNGT